MISLSLRDAFYRGRRDAAVLFLRASKPDSDTVPLLQLISRQHGVRRIFLAVKDKTTAEPYLNMLADSIENENRNVSIVDRKQLVGALVRSRIVCLKNGLRDAPGLRPLAGKRVVLFHDHGLVTKLPTDTSSRSIHDSPFHDHKRQPVAIRVTQGKLHGHVQLSKLRKLKAERVLPLGYPRFYRARDLYEKSAISVVSPDGQKFLSNYDSTYKILWAPTHPREGDPVFLDILGYDPHEIDTWLQKNNAVIFTRLHAKNRDIRSRDRTLPDRVVGLPDDIAPGAVELLGHMDCVVTDWSSIMMEAFAFDLPVIHTMPAGGHPPILYEEAVSMPGYRVRTQSEFLDALGVALRVRRETNPAVTYWNLRPNSSIGNAYAAVFSALNE